MGFKLKKVLKKVEKAVKKVAPAALTVVNPALGASWIAANRAMQAAKQRGDGGTSADIATISGVGATGYTSPDGIASFGSPQPLTGDNQRFNQWQAGGYGKSAASLLKSPIAMLVIVGIVAVLAIAFLRRRR